MPLLDEMPDADADCTIDFADAPSIEDEGLQRAAWMGWMLGSTAIGYALDYVRTEWLVTEVGKDEVFGWEELAKDLSEQKGLYVYNSDTYFMVWDGNPIPDRSIES